MADNITLNSGSGGATLATDDVGGAHYQIVKLAYGAPDSATIVSAANPLPVSDAGGSITVDASSLPLPAGAATAALQTTANTHLEAIKTAVQTLDDAVSGSEVQVDVVTQPARDRATDNLGVALQTDAIMNDTTALVPKFAAFGVNSSGDNQLVDTTAGKKCRVLSIAIFARGAVDVYFKSEGGTVVFGDSTHKIKLDSTGAAGAAGFALAFNPVGWFQTDVAGEDLEINLSAAVGVSGGLTYVEV